MATNVTFGNYNPTEEEDAKAINVNIDIYFDGTLNNMTNTDERRNNSTAFQDHGVAKKQDTSYYNDWSNVARLWEASSQQTKIYLEGIGTEDREGDSTLGYAYGTGSTGVRGKVKKGCEKVAEKVREERDKAGAVKVTTLTLDVFGFSRGSAAARNFVHEVGRQKHKSQMVPVAMGRTVVLQRQDNDGNPTTLDELPAWGFLGQKLQELNVDVDNLRVRFLGIFDTVSSYSPNFTLTPDFSNDVDELHLNHIGHSRNVVHFVAADEHRQNFSLTHSPVGIEKSFPGVHSDIGGSYEDGEEIIQELETSWTLRSRLEPFRRKLIEDGWYKENELTITGGTAYWALQGTRNLKKSYSYIPLQFMAEIGVSKSIPFKTSTTHTKYDIEDDPLLVRVKGRLKKYILEGGPAYTFIPNSDNQEQQDLKILRNKYLHWSAKREGIGMDPNSDRRRIVY